MKLSRSGWYIYIRRRCSNIFIYEDAAQILYACVCVCVCARARASVSARFCAQAASGHGSRPYVCVPITRECVSGSVGGLCERLGRGS